jgi:hypothetical protein
MMVHEQLTVLYVYGPYFARSRHTRHIEKDEYPASV